MYRPPITEKEFDLVLEALRFKLREQHCDADFICGQRMSSEETVFLAQFILQLEQFKRAVPAC